MAKAVRETALPGIIVVRVVNMPNNQGRLRVALCTEAQWLGSIWSAVVAVPASGGAQVVTLQGIAPGTYGVMVHHDINGDGVINRDRLGRPTEGIGFSRDAPMLFGPPRFKDACFTYKGGDMALDVALRFGPRR
jgi:uncharacterized protein (DUF2141 family)